MTRQLTFMRAVLLMLCLFFTSSASAYLHIGEHQHSQEFGLAHHHAAEAHQHAPQDVDHEHHFHLHVIGDLVDHQSLTADENVQAFAPEISLRLSTLAYAPPIPPPNH